MQVFLASLPWWLKLGFPICRPRTGGYYTLRNRLHPKYLTGDRPGVIVFDRDFAGMSVLPPERKVLIIAPDTVSTCSNARRRGYAWRASRCSSRRSPRVYSSVSAS